MAVHEIIETERLRIRKPETRDVEEIFARYASDPDVCCFLSWPMHVSLEDTNAFLEFSNGEWSKWPAGPYLMRSKSDGQLLGGTGLDFESATVASTGYVLAKDAWGRGLATEALKAMRELAAALNVERLYSHVHPQHLASRRVLEKAAFRLDGTLLKSFEFPNLGKGELFDVVSYSCRPKELSGEFIHSDESGSDT
jgi:RimJ/RimL family protein N-acetyltransferase